jgi:ElaB/YqjD/DUF883 family membrane-anchored ribosome-binding protein
MGSSELTSELLALKQEIARAIHAGSDRMAEASTSSVDEIAGQIKSALTDTLTDLGHAFVDEDSHVHTIITQRPLATLASAFALGVVVGLLLRRR